MAQRFRYAHTVEGFVATFGDEGDLMLFSAPGRTEIGGNHTDHNFGRVLAGSVNLDVIAVVRPAAGVIRMQSEGYPMITVDTAELIPVDSEQNGSASLIRGTAARFTQLDYAIGGFDAYATSNVLKGSGLSSSAAFEVLIGVILSHLYNDGKVTAVEIAQIAQYAENVYFGKPCGLMDQMASSTGGLVAIDFKAEPVVQPLSFRFNEAGYDIVVINSGSSHDNLTDEYASIRQEMQAVAGMFGEEVLRRVRPEQLWMEMDRVRKQLGERAVLRALHFFQENDRVKKLVHDVKLSDLGAMFEGIIASGESSWMMLQNVYVPGIHQPLALALSMAAQQLRGKGAWRVHGGGFAGTTLNFVPSDMTEEFVQKMCKVFGEHACFVLDVRPEGAAIVFKQEK